MDIYTTIHPTKEKCTFFLGAHRTSTTKIVHIVAYKTSLNKCGMIQRIQQAYQTRGSWAAGLILGIQDMFSDDSRIELKISNKKISGKAPKCLKI